MLQKKNSWSFAYVSLLLVIKESQKALMEVIALKKIKQTALDNIVSSIQLLKVE